MRKRLSAVLLAAVAATVTGVVPASAAVTDCDPEQCPESCKLFERIFSRPICDAVSGGTVVVEGGVFRA